MFNPSYVQDFSFNINEMIQRGRLQIEKPLNIGFMLVTYWFTESSFDKAKWTVGNLARVKTGPLIVEFAAFEHHNRPYKCTMAPRVSDRCPLGYLFIFFCLVNIISLVL